MAMRPNSNRFFKLLFQTDLQRLRIPNKFKRRLSLSNNPVLIKPPDGTKWKVGWKYFKGDIWFEKGWKNFTQNYSLEVGSLVVFKYEEGTSIFNVLVFGKNGVEIDYVSSCHTHDDDENDSVDHSSDDESVDCSSGDEKKDNNVDDSDDESVEILDVRLNRKKKKKKKRNRQSSPLGSPRPHTKKVRGEFEKNIRSTSSLNWPKEAEAQEVAAKFISNNPFFTILVKHNRLVQGQLCVPCFKGVFENKEKCVKLQIGKLSWNVKLLPYCNEGKGRRFSAGWPLFASESGLKSGDVCVFELINKNDLVFKVHVF